MLRELYLKKKTLKSKKKRHSENRIFLSMAMISTICGLVSTLWTLREPSATPSLEGPRDPLALRTLGPARTGRP